MPSVFKLLSKQKLIFPLEGKVVAMFSNTQVIHVRDRKFQAHKTNTYTSKHVNTINRLILILSGVILMSGGSFQSK